MKLHFGHVTMRLLLCGIGDSLEHPLPKHSLLPFKYLSGQIEIFRETFKNVLKKSAP